MKKRCSQCKELKDVSEFCVDKRNRSGLAAECKRCHTDASQEWKKENRELYSSRRRKAYQVWKEANKDNPMSWRKWSGWTHGLRITVEQYQTLLTKQGGVCAVCHKPEKRRDSRNGKLRMLCVDHDHQTDEIRGLLCSDCNTAIGLCSDDPGILVAAAEYLRAHAKSNIVKFREPDQAAPIAASEANWSNVP